MRNKKYSEKELEFVKNNFRDKSNADIGKILNRTACSVGIVLYHLKLWRTTDEKKLVRKRSKNDLTDYQKFFIVENANTLTNKEIADYLNIPQSKVICYFRQNLKRSPEIIKKLKSKGQKIGKSNQRKVC